MIDAREIVAILSIFNIHLFDEQTHPIKAYSSKAVLLKQYLEDDTPESYRRFSDIAVDIFELYELLRQNSLMRIIMPVEDMAVKSILDIKGKVK